MLNDGSWVIQSQEGTADAFACVEIDVEAITFAETDNSYEDGTNPSDEFIDDSTSFENGTQPTNETVDDSTSFENGTQPDNESADDFSNFEDGNFDFDSAVIDENGTEATVESLADLDASKILYLIENYLGGFFYALLSSEDDITYQEAEKYCRAEGMIVALILSESQNDEVRSVFLSTFSPDTYQLS